MIPVAARIHLAARVGAATPMKTKKRKRKTKKRKKMAKRKPTPPAAHC